jgi:hypothetical protein
VIRFGRSLLDQRHWRPPTRVASKSSAVPVSAVGAVPSSLASSAFESKDDSCAEFEGPAPRKAPLRFSVSRRSMLLSPWARSWVSSAGHLVSRVRKWTKQAGGGRRTSYSRLASFLRDLSVMFWTTVRIDAATDGTDGRSWVRRAVCGPLKTSGKCLGLQGQRAVSAQGVSRVSYVSPDALDELTLNQA